MATEYKLSYTASEIDEGLGKAINLTVDATLDSESANPVQNRVVTEKLNEYQEWHTGMANVVNEQTNMIEDLRIQINEINAKLSYGLLPSVTAADNGKVLMVVNGEWQLVSGGDVPSEPDLPSEPDAPEDGSMVIESDGAGVLSLTHSGIDVNGGNVNIVYSGIEVDGNSITIM